MKFVFVVVVVWGLSFLFFLVKAHADSNRRMVEEQKERNDLEMKMRRWEKREWEEWLERNREKIWKGLMVMKNRDGRELEIEELKRRRRDLERERKVG